MHKNNNPLHNNGSALLPHVGYVRLPTILKVFPISKSTWWLGIRAGRFPKGIKLSSNITAWKAEDIFELIANNGCIKGNVGDDNDSSIKLTDNSKSTLSLKIKRR